MRKIPPARYRSAEEIEREIRQKQSMADALPGGDSKQKLLIEVAQLKSYAEAKRWVASKSAIRHMQ